MSPWGTGQKEDRAAVLLTVLMLGGLQQASVVGHDLVLRQVQVELQRHQDGELEGDQLPAVHPESLL